MNRYDWNKKWRKTHPAGRNASKARYYKKHRETPENRRNSNQKWSEHEVALLLSPSRPPDSILAKVLGRSVQALQGKRSKLAP